MIATSNDDSLTTRSIHAAQWRVGGAIVSAISQLVVGVLLARLLTPADFGLTALAYVSLGLMRPLCDLGIGSAIVQTDHLTDRHIRTGFTTCILIGLAAAAIAVLVAPVGAAVLRSTNVTSILRVLSVGFPIRGTAIVAEALLRRRLDLRQQVLIETSSYLFGFAGVAVTLALLGYGVWSLVWGGLAQLLLASLTQLAVVRHPMRPLVALRELSELLRFGIAAALSAWVNYLALNGDSFLVGRILGTVNLGLYARAYALMNLPQTYAAGVISNVMFPAFAQAQGDPVRVGSAYLLVTRFTGMIAAPALATLTIVAPHLVMTLYGPKWADMVTPLQILSLAGYFRVLYHLGGVAAQSMGRVSGELWRQVTYAVAVASGTLVGARYGVPGVAVGVSVAILYMFVATGHLILNATAIPWRSYLRNQAAPLITAACTGVVAVVIRLLLEGTRTSGTIITLAVLAAVAFPWTIGVLWILGDPDAAPLRMRLPRECLRLVTTLRRIR
jgi:PST family polysaccharide transporter